MATRVASGALIVAAVACGRADASDLSMGTGEMLADDTPTLLAQADEGDTQGPLTRASAKRVIEKDSLFRYGGGWAAIDLEEQYNERKCAEVAGVPTRMVPVTPAALARASGLVTLVDSAYQGTFACVQVTSPRIDSIPKNKAEAKAAGALEFTTIEPTSMLGKTRMLWVRLIRPVTVTITGIVQEQQSTRAQAEFTYHSRASHQKYQAVLWSHPDSLGGGNGVAFFQRYDDGWRLTRLQW